MTTQQDSVDVERLREALRECAEFIRLFKKEGVELFGTGIHTGLRKGTEAPNAMLLWSFIANSKTTAWPDALAFALDPFFTMWGGDKALAKADAALSLPITQRDEHASRRAESALSVAELLVPFTTHNIGCAVYQQSYASGSPICTCGVEAAREAVTAIRRLSIEQGDQDEGTPA